MQTRIYVMFLALIVTLLAIIPAVAAEETNQTDEVWYWYNQAVDLANAGKFPEALAANEKALALYKDFPLGWANEAGILVQVGRYDDAIAAADNVLNYNRTGRPMVNTFAAAYYSKGDALRALGNISGAQECYIKAHELDSSLPVPDLSGDNAVPMKATPTRSPLSLMVVIGSLVALFGYACFQRRGQ